MKTLVQSFIVALFALGYCVNVNAQSKVEQPAAIFKFTDYEKMPQRAIYSSFANDGKYLYTLNGYLYNRSVSTRAMRFDPATNNWQIVSNNLVPKTRAASIYVPSTHKIYTIGGLNGFVGALFYKVETVDTQTGEVKVSETENPFPQLNTGIAVWNNKIYVFGGSSDRYGSNRLYEFDVATEKFKRLADMPYFAETSGTMVDGVLYTFGGYNPYNSFTFDDIYAYDIQNNSWKKAGKLPKQISATSVVAYGKYVFLAGSYSHPGFIGYYDTKLNNFTAIKSNMFDRRYASTAVIGNQLFIYAGSSSIVDPGVTKVQGAVIDPDMLATK